MRRALPLVLLLVLLPPRPGGAAEDWQRRAVELHPELGVAGSAMNIRFLALREQRLKTNPSFFKDPRWPVLLARECAARSVPGRAPQASGSSPTPGGAAAGAESRGASSGGVPATSTRAVSPELAEGRDLYLARCARCHDPYEPGPVAETTWARWLYKWKARAGVSDDEYYHLIDYGKLARAAWQADLATRANSASSPGSAR